MVGSAAAMTAAGIPAAGAAEAATEDRRDPRAVMRERTRQSMAALRQCLDRPSQACALRAALMVTAAETLSIDRSKVLLSVADTLHAVGDQARAERTVSVAKSEARDIGIGFAVDTRLVDVAEIEAKIGAAEAAADTAAAIEDQVLRARAFGRIAVALVEAGRADRAAAMLDRIEVGAVAQEYALQVAEILTAAEAGGAGARAALDTAARLVDAAPMSRFRLAGRIRLAAARARFGEAEAARALAAEVEQDLGRSMPSHARARLLADLAVLDLALDDRAAHETHMTAARRALDKVRSDYERDYALSDVAIAAARGGAYDAALDLAEQIDSVDVRTRFARRLARLDRSAAARRALATYADRTARDHLDKLDQPYTRDEARFALVMALVEAGSAQPAVSVVETMEDDDARARGLAFVARLLD
ncbi:hypothetical protein [Rhodothalassium salexigens]|uniref:hypothetical protein n=1 Tax=Rhodothalassium salexigens TaxID=1086 RepID=UPI001050CEBC|nr:hypothetical protein [Rhodothalassium salexigens]MBB4210016.1 hypothetical protein [Rhodothalassium salexigens DSM 2132]